ncbi:hypothetical protein DQ237_18390 [Blastococcus sp. TF02-8]|uniref:hypothetical protein n=1 Tax=Blastococcus sp. TF02-8 TaxID=2250574 RepID=UPI000DEAB0A3|nr:hypothetical protein [Blastococcus sp. TF02-8]RBY93413.1 hypothetical protein DQ237_18390 [Blastococcus sp. TF02-8]
MTRLTADDVACWLLKSALVPERLADTWTPGEEVVLDRCVRPSYRLGLMSPGRPCVLWVSGRDRPGVHALGTVTGDVDDRGGGPTVPVRLRLLAEPVPRADLAADPDFSRAEVLRMPAGSNPSWLTAGQYAAVLSRVSQADLGPWPA